MLTRRSLARETRREAAELAFLRPHPRHINNGEESDYRNPPPGGLNFIANYSKGLPHNELGEVDPVAYRAMLKAVNSGEFNDFEQIPAGCTPDLTSLDCNVEMPRRLINPQAGLAFDLEGPDAQAVTMPPAPRIDGPENSAEMAELYWMALLRDVNFTDYGNDSGPNTTTEAADSLTDDFSAFSGPRDSMTGRVTPATLFRGFTPDDLVGPLLSQFLLRPVIFGTLRINQRQRTAQPGVDFMIDYNEWLCIQNGCRPANGDQFDPTRRFIRNARDLATYVHFDALYEAYLNACLILLDLRVPFDQGNPYNTAVMQEGFGTFGGPHILSLVTEVATRALKAVWYQKWFVHRRLRPEAFGGLVHNQVTEAAEYPIDPEILDRGPGNILDRINQQNRDRGSDTFLLPQAFPEGSPLHPAYGSGHSTVAGACVTILKAFFDESFVIPNPVVPDADGRALVNAPADTPPLTVRGELNKVAANISIGRLMAGVHWRTDYSQAVRLGEEVAIGILEEQALTYNEPASFTLTRFDGTAITIGA